MEGQISRAKRLLPILILTAFAGAPVSVFATDAGPAKAVRDVRWAAARVLHVERIDSIVVDGSQALAQSTTLAGTRIDGFAYIYDRWWHLLSAPSSACVDAWMPFTRGIPQPLLDLARANFKAFTLTNASIASGDAGCGAAQTPPSQVRPRPAESDGYDLTIAAQQPIPARSLRVTVRRPTEGENWTIYPRGNAYAYFTIHSSAPSAIAFSQGATVDVRCPFVVEPEKRYSITVANIGQPALGPLDGHLRDGVLHFALPAFVIPPNGELLGEIDGSPP